jgi:SnoaL-like domain
VPGILKSGRLFLANNLPLATKLHFVQYDLLQAEKCFMQMTPSGVIEIKGDPATARFVERERGRGESSYYDSLAVYEDVLVREADGWRFAKRFYHYRFLNQSPFGGEAFPVT